jgi:isopentenyl-diphosphate delta-isomerase
MPATRRWKSGLAEAAKNPNAEVVSREDENLVLVDESDRVVGHLSKGACHDGEGVLHRAFSLFVFNREGQLLLQQRSEKKRLWPLFWSNTCCSHPREGETMDEAVHRRLHEELRMTSELEFLYKFQYQASYEDIGSENEICWVRRRLTTKWTPHRRSSRPGFRWSGRACGRSTGSSSDYDIARARRLHPSSIASSSANVKQSRAKRSPVRTSPTCSSLSG